MYYKIDKNFESIIPVLYSLKLALFVKDSNQWFSYLKYFVTMTASYTIFPGRKVIKITLIVGLRSITEVITL